VLRPAISTECCAAQRGAYLAEQANDKGKSIVMQRDVADQVEVAVEGSHGCVFVFSRRELRWLMLGRAAWHALH
jgi:hypothetical protein